MTTGANFVYVSRQDLHTHDHATRQGAFMAYATVFLVAWLAGYRGQLQTIPDYQGGMTFAFVAEVQT